MVSLLTQNNIKQSLLWPDPLHDSLSDLIFPFLPAHWTLATLTSLFGKHTNSAPTSGHLDLLFPLLVILFPQISAWLGPSVCSCLYLDVTFAERSPLITLIPPYPKKPPLILYLLTWHFTFMYRFIYCLLSVFPNKRCEGKEHILSPVIALLSKIVPEVSR